MMWRRQTVVLALIALSVASASVAAPRPEYGKVEVITDTWGVPHAFSNTDEGAFYALGWATAQERGFQMTFSLRIMQGRVAEILGPKKKTTRNDTTVDSDRMARTFGWERAADRVAANLDAPSRALLQAYSEGVNDSFADQAREGKLHPLFEKLGCAPEPWTPADCLLSWWHLAQFFATDGTRDLMQWRNQSRPDGLRPPPATALWHDDGAAVVQRSDVQDAWVRRVEEFAALHGFDKPVQPGAEAPKMSHAWVVGGKRSTTGAAVLVSDPQTPVRHPSLLQEFHIVGKTLNVRGVGVAGSPILLIGFNRHVAWGMTALGADQADLFRLETDPSSPDRYRWDVRSAGVLPEDGQWRTMETRKETIRVKGGDPVEIAVRTTHLGPIVNDFAFRAPGDPDVALRRVPLCDEGVETIQGALAMMRATNVEEFAAGCGGWRFPSANCVFGDSRGRIGYRAVGAIPIRPRSAPDRNGGQGISATGNADAWQGFVPADLMPGVTDPDAGVILSANHRPVASFYSIPIGAGTGAMGETIRSWRLRELLAGDAKLTPEDVLKVHYDTVNPARREIVRLGLHLRDHGGGLSDAALRALQALEPWFRAGASSDLRSPGAALATRISTFFRIMATPLARRYGGGESGLARFLKDAARRIGADPAAAFDAEEREFVDQALSEAMQGAQGRPGAARPAVQDARSRRADRGAGASPAAGSSLRLGWFESLDGFGSLDAEGDLAGPAITCLDGQTIHCQSSQSYTQWVSLADPDSARVICPVGHSDRIESPYRASTAELWGKAELHAAPLSREAVQKVAHSHRVLSR